MMYESWKHAPENRHCFASMHAIHNPSFIILIQGCGRKTEKAVATTEIEQLLTKRKLCNTSKRNMQACVGCADVEHAKNTLQGQTSPLRSSPPLSEESCCGRGDSLQWSGGKAHLRCLPTKSTRGESGHGRGESLQWSGGKLICDACQQK